MSTIFNQMLLKYDIITPQDSDNAILEVMQQIALAGLYRAGFFDKAAFYGGTCLRIFHGLDRFSEDLDFSLLTQDMNFKIENYFDAIADEFKFAGRDIVITKKEKVNFSRVDSAFLKDNTQVYDIAFNSHKQHKVKLEVDICPPLNFATEQKLLLNPYSFMTRCFTASSLFAGKMHALVFRSWKNRVKGRDWYDFEWYIKNGVKLDFEHLKERIKEFNNLEITKDEFLNLLNEKLSSTDIKLVKQDLMPFIKSSEAIDIYSNEYFLQLASFIKFE